LLLKFGNYRRAASDENGDQKRWRNLGWVQGEAEEDDGGICVVEEHQPKKLDNNSGSDAEEQVTRHRGNRPVTGAAEELAAPAAASGAVAGISRLIPNPINDPG